MADLNSLRGHIKHSSSAIKCEGHAPHSLHLVLWQALPQVVEDEARLEDLPVIPEKEGSVVLMRSQQGAGLHGQLPSHGCRPMISYLLLVWMTVWVWVWGGRGGGGPSCSGLPAIYACSSLADTPQASLLSMHAQVLQTHRNLRLEQAGFQKHFVRKHHQPPREREGFHAAHCKRSQQSEAWTVKNACTFAGQHPTPVLFCHSEVSNNLA